VPPPPPCLFGLVVIGALDLPWVGPVKKKEVTTVEDLDGRGVGGGEAVVSIGKAVVPPS
jgi:hypothetical protein